MSPRPTNNSRANGCFLLFFFLIWTAVTVGIMSLLLFGNPTVEGNPMGLYIIVGVFLLIDVVGLIYVMRHLTGKTSRRPSGNSDIGTLSALPSMAPATRTQNGYCHLKPETTHRAQFFILLVFAIIWNGVVGCFVGTKVTGNGADDAPWWFLSIFIVIGVLVLFGAIYFFFRWIMVGETTVHVSADPVVPGQLIEIRVSQPGRFKIDQMKVDLILQEQATYRRGTDTHTKREIVREEPVCEITNMKARGEKVLAHQSVHVPADAISSFETFNNTLAWMIRVKMTLPGRPDVEQCFPIRIATSEILKLEGSRHG